MIELQSITKAYNGKIILNELNLKVEKNEILALLGPNGCGKTTVLNLISGLSRPNHGNIIIDNVIVAGKVGEKMVHLPPYARKVGYVFQTNTLFPHMRIVDNVAYGLKAKHLSKQEIKNRVRELLNFVDMFEYAEYYPHQISGGQKQRVALARSLATDPQVLLLDEPISAVDAKLRESLRVEFKKILRSLNITAIYVTHNLTEAIMMSDKIAIMGNGKIEQIGNRADILDKPNSKYVAEFLGLNVYDAKAAVGSFGQMKVEINGVFISVPPFVAVNGQLLLVTLKPEDVLLLPMQATEKSDAGNGYCIVLKGAVTEISLMRSIARVTVNVGFPVKSELTLNSLGDLGLSEGDTIYVSFKAEALNISLLDYSR